jgi:hypothetical protein
MPKGRLQRERPCSCDSSNARKDTGLTVKASPSEEKRKHPRIDFHLGVMIRGRQGLKEIRNFGLGGVFVGTEDPSQFESGDEVYLIMKFPSETKAMQVKSRVAHTSDKGIGVEFIDLNPRNAMSMEYCFNIFRHTVPLPGT